MSIAMKRTYLLGLCNSALRLHRLVQTMYHGFDFFFYITICDHFFSYHFLVLLQVKLLLSFNSFLPFTGVSNTSLFSLSKLMGYLVFIVLSLFFFFFFSFL